MYSGSGRKTQSSLLKQGFFRCPGWPQLPKCWDYSTIPNSAILNADRGDTACVDITSVLSACTLYVIWLKGSFWFCFRCDLPLQPRFACKLLYILGKPQACSNPPALVWSTSMQQNTRLYIDMKYKMAVPISRVTNFSHFCVYTYFLPFFLLFLLLLRQFLCVTTLAVKKLTL